LPGGLEPVGFDVSFSTPQLNGAGIRDRFGSVQLWRGEAYVKADRLKAAGQGGKNSQVHAEALPGSKVQSTLQNIRATSDSLDYDDALGVIRYMGHVMAQKQDMIVETPDMTVNFRDKVVTEIVASGGVTFTRAD